MWLANEIKKQIFISTCAEKSVVLNKEILKFNKIQDTYKFSGTIQRHAIFYTSVYS